MSLLAGNDAPPLLTVACRFVPYDQWFVTHLDPKWKIKQVKLWILSKSLTKFPLLPFASPDQGAIPAHVLQPPPPSRPYRSASPITFASIKQASEDTFEDSRGRESPLIIADLRKSIDEGQNELRADDDTGVGTAEQTQRDNRSEGEDGVRALAEDGEGGEDPSSRPPPSGRILPSDSQSPSHNDIPFSQIRQTATTPNPHLPSPRAMIFKSATNTDAKIRDGPSAVYGVGGYGGKAPPLQSQGQQGKISAAFTLIRFSTGQVLEEDFPVSWYDIAPYELLELHGGDTLLSRIKRHRTMTSNANSGYHASTMAQVDPLLQLSYLGRPQKDKLGGLFDEMDDLPRLRVIRLNRNDLEAYIAPYWEGWVRALRVVYKDDYPPGHPLHPYNGSLVYKGGGTGLGLDYFDPEFFKKNKDKDKEKREKQKGSGSLLSTSPLVPDQDAKPKSGSRRTRLEWRDRWVIIKDGMLILAKDRNDPNPSHRLSLATLTSLRGAEHLAKTTFGARTRPQDPAPQQHPTHKRSKTFGGMGDVGGGSTSTASTTNSPPPQTVGVSSGRSTAEGGTHRNTPHVGKFAEYRDANEKDLKIVCAKFRVVRRNNSVAEDQSKPIAIAPLNSGNAMGGGGGGSTGVGLGILGIVTAPAAPSGGGGSSQTVHLPAVSGPGDDFFGTRTVITSTVVATGAGAGGENKSSKGLMGLSMLVGGSSSMRSKDKDKGKGKEKEKDDQRLPQSSLKTPGTGISFLGIWDNKDKEKEREKEKSRGVLGGISRSKSKREKDKDKEGKSKEKQKKLKTGLFSGTSSSDSEEDRDRNVKLAQSPPSNASSNRDNIIVTSSSVVVPFRRRSDYDAPTESVPPMKRSTLASATTSTSASASGLTTYVGTGTGVKIARPPMNHSLSAGQSGESVKRTREEKEIRSAGSDTSEGEEEEEEDGDEAVEGGTEGRERRTGATEEGEEAKMSSFDSDATLSSPVFAPTYPPELRGSGDEEDSFWSDDPNSDRYLYKYGANRTFGYRERLDREKAARQKEREREKKEKERQMEAEREEREYFRRLAEREEIEEQRKIMQSIEDAKRKAEEQRLGGKTKKGVDEKKKKAEEESKRLEKEKKREREREREREKEKSGREEARGEWIVLDLGSDDAYHSILRILHRHAPLPISSSFLHNLPIELDMPKPSTTAINLASPPSSSRPSLSLSADSHSGFYQPRSAAQSPDIFGSGSSTVLSSQSHSNQNSIANSMKFSPSSHTYSLSDPQAGLSGMNSASFMGDAPRSSSRALNLSVPYPEWRRELVSKAQRAGLGNIPKPMEWWMLGKCSENNREEWKWKDKWKLGQEGEVKVADDEADDNRNDVDEDKVDERAVLSGDDEEKDALEGKDPEEQGSSDLTATGAHGLQRGPQDFEDVGPYDGNREMSPGELAEPERESGGHSGDEGDDGGSVLEEPGMTLAESNSDDGFSLDSEDSEEEVSESEWKGWVLDLPRQARVTIQREQENYEGDVLSRAVSPSSAGDLSLDQRHPYEQKTKQGSQFYDYPDRGTPTPGADYQTIARGASSTSPPSTVPNFSTLNLSSPISYDPLAKRNRAYSVGVEATEYSNLNPSPPTAFYPNRYGQQYQTQVQSQGSSPSESTVELVPHKPTLYHSFSMQSIGAAMRAGELGSESSSQKYIRGGDGVVGPRAMGGTRPAVHDVFGRRPSMPILSSLPEFNGDSQRGLGLARGGSLGSGSLLRHNDVRLVQEYDQEYDTGEEHDFGEGLRRRGSAGQSPNSGRSPVRQISPTYGQQQQE